MLARLKVTLVTHSYLAEENRKKLSLLGWEVDLEVVSPDRATTPLFRYRMQRRVLEEDSYTMRFYRPLPEAGIPARYLMLSRDLNLSRFRPDLVHLELGPWVPLAQQVMACARRHVPRAALVCTVRQHTYTTYGPLTPLKDWLARRIIRRVDRFLAGNDGSRQMLVERFGVSPDRIQLNPQLGVDTDHFCPVSPEQRAERRRHWRLAGDAIVVGYCGRFVEEKGLLHLLEAVHRVRAQTRTRIQLALLGDGPLRPRLESSGDPDLVLHRTVPHTEVARFLQALDIFVLPTVAITPSLSTLELDAHALQEAMSCGVASVGTRSGPIPEVLEGAGVLVAPSEAAPLGEAIAQLLDPAVRTTWGEAARRRILERYSNERVVERQLDTYRQAVADRQQRV